MVLRKLREAEIDHILTTFPWSFKGLLIKGSNHQQIKPNSTQTTLVVMQNYIIFRIPYFWTSVHTCAGVVIFTSTWNSGITMKRIIYIFLFCLLIVETFLKFTQRGFCRAAMRGNTSTPARADPKMNLAAAVAARRSEI